MIYPEKRKGRLTGTFVIEVEFDGQRLKARSKDFKEAQNIERKMKIGRWEKAPPPAPPKDTRLSVGELYRTARAGDWKQGQANATRSYKEVEWCLEIIGREVKVDDVNLNHFKAIKEAKLKQGVQLQTADRVMNAFSSLITWARENVDAQGKPLTTNRPYVPLSGIVRERTEWFTAQDQDRIISRMVAGGYQAEAVCVLAFGQTGMRASELLTLKADQIKQDTIILFDQKNGTWGEGIPIQPEVAKALRIIVERKQLPSYRMLLERLKKAAEAEGFKVNTRLPQNAPRASKGPRRSTLDTVGLHTLRHSTATRLILDGESPAVVQEYMRHASWATTRKYLKLTGEPKRQALARLVGDTGGVRGTLRGILELKPLENLEKNVGSAGDPMRGNLDEKRENIAKVAKIASEIREENQGNGAQGRNRTTDTAIFSPSPTIPLSE